MYNITFGRLNGESVSFENVTELHTGKSIPDLKKVPEEQILSCAFNVERCVFQLIGKNFNVTFYEKTDYISIYKTND